LDPQILILAGVDDDRFDEDFLPESHGACVQNLQQAAMTLFFGPRRRSTVVKTARDDAGQ